MNAARKLIPHRIIPSNLYVEREADRQLESILDDMASPGYVLVSRQMGKTNLLLNARRKYQVIGYDVFTYIDLSNSFDSDIQCFRNIIDKSLDTHKDLIGHLTADIKLVREQGMPSHLEHLSELRLILSKIPGKMVIILDEIDALTRASFSDKIFSQIRSIYFERDSYVELKRLTYVLSGVMEPSEIIRDSKISPFNIGQKIFLDDFSFNEHENFLMRAELDLGKDVSNQIFKWTSGNPRMTYDISSELEKLIISNQPVTIDSVDKVIKNLYLTNFDKAPVDHIRELVADSKVIRDAITVIRYGRGSQLDHSIKTKLYLAGIISSDFTSKNLGIKNRIIDESLSESWIKAIENKNQDINTLVINAIVVNDYRKVVSLISDFDGDPEDLTIETHYNTGLSYFKTGVYDKAIIALEKADFDLEYERSYFLDKKYFLAESYNFNKNPDKAINLFNEIKDIDKTGRYYYLSIIALGNIYIDYQGGKNIDLAISYFNEIFDNQNLLIEKYTKTFHAEMFASVHLYSGLAYTKLKQKEEAKKHFDTAFELSEGRTKPLILLGQYNVETVISRRNDILDDIIDSITEANLFPNPSSEYYSYFSHQVLYNIFDVLNKTSHPKFNFLFEYLLNHKSNLQSDEFGEVIFHIAINAGTAGNVSLTSKLLRLLLSDNYKDKIPSSYIYPALQLLITTGLHSKSDTTEYKERLYHYLQNNTTKVLTPFDLDTIMTLADSKIPDQNYNQVQELLTFLYNSLEIAGEEMKHSKLVLEMIEIKVLQSANFTDQVQTRSQSLLNNLNKLTANEINSNPFLKQSIDRVKNYLSAIHTQVNLAKLPERKFGDNERVNVRYIDTNKIVTNIKYKKVRNDIWAGKCHLY